MKKSFYLLYFYLFMQVYVMVDVYLKVHVRKKNKKPSAFSHILWRCDLAHFVSVYDNSFYWA